MRKLIQNDDLVEVLFYPFFNDLTGARGVVIKSYDLKYAIVAFPTDRQCSDYENDEVLKGRHWFIPWKDLKVIDSPKDDKIGELENQLQDALEDLCVARACLTMSEEIREQQAELISKLIVDIDKLQKELYDSRGW